MSIVVGLYFLFGLKQLCLDLDVFFLTFFQFEFVPLLQKMALFQGLQHVFTRGAS